MNVRLRKADPRETRSVVEGTDSEATFDKLVCGLLVQLQPCRALRPSPAFGR